MYICVCVRSNLPPHTLESQKRGTNRFIAIREPFFQFNDFAKKCFVQKLWHKFTNLEQLRCSSAAFFHEMNFYASFEVYSYMFTARTTSTWKTACDRLPKARDNNKARARAWPL